MKIVDSYHWPVVIALGFIQQMNYSTSFSDNPLPNGRKPQNQNILQKVVGLVVDLVGHF